MSETGREEMLVLLDSEPLYKAVARELTNRRSIPQGGSFARGCRITRANASISLIHLPAANAHVQAYLTLLEMQQRSQFSRILAVGEGFSLRRELRAADLVVIGRASALPYPALFENRPPSWQTHDASARPSETFYSSAPATASSHAQLPALKPLLWQEDLPTVHAAYARHPQWQGGMPLWAPEHFEKFRRENEVDVLAELPVGVLEFAAEHPQALIECYAFILGQTASSSGMTGDDRLAHLRTGFYRHQKRGIVPAVNLILKRVEEFCAGPVAAHN